MSYKKLIKCIVKVSVLGYFPLYMVSVFGHGYRIWTPPLSMELKDSIKFKNHLNIYNHIILI